MAWMTDPLKPGTGDIILLYMHLISNISHKTDSITNTHVDFPHKYLNSF